MNAGAMGQYFDRWYADIIDCPVKDEVEQRTLGLPPRLLSTSLLGWDGLAEVVDALGLSGGDIVVDLACGRGGYGLEIAGRTGAGLVGVDVSAEAVRQAGEHARRLGQVAEFRVGDLVATDLGSDSVEAIVCVDAVQFADQPSDAFAEMMRILAPGGRVVLTCWEPLDRDDDRVPDRLRRVDLDAGLSGAGFSHIEVRERPGWRAAERAMWTEAAALDPGEDPALLSFHDEGVRSLSFFDLLRRVMAVATARSPPLETSDVNSQPSSGHAVRALGGAGVRFCG
jgi:SAM-dependent methyltransferase